MPMVHRLSRLNGFHVHASDGALGHVDDFLVDEATWLIRYLVVDTSNWLGGKWVAVSASAVTRIDWSAQEIHVSMTRDGIKNSPSLEEAHVPSYELTPGFIIM
jgi:hypothetical protein